MTNTAVAIEAHIAGLRRYARALLGNRPEADELVQECLVRALARVDSWNKIGDLRAYLFSIQHNIYVDYIKSRRRMMEQQVQTFDVFPAIPPSQDLSLEVRDLVRALGRLPEEQRQVVLLVALEGLSYQQVATIVGAPIGTIMSRLSRGREALRIMMDVNERPRRRRASRHRKSTMERAGTPMDAAA